MAVLVRFYSNIYRLFIFSRVFKKLRRCLVVGILCLLFILLKTKPKYDDYSINWRQPGMYPENVPWRSVINGSQSLAVYIVEEHHEVIPYWIHALKHNGFRKAYLIHIDAHSDLDYPEVQQPFPLGRLPVNDREVAAMMQGNDQFIQSAIISQFITGVALVYPPWAHVKTAKSRMYLGLVQSTEERRICICYIDADQCQTTNAENFTQEISLNSNECDKRWGFDLLEAEAGSLVEQEIRWSIFDTQEKAEYQIPIILDIDEDFFGVHLVAHNLTRTGMTLENIKRISETIEKMFCPERFSLEEPIDIWFRELLQQIAMQCFHHNELQIACLRELHRNTLEILMKKNKEWLCTADLTQLVGDLLTLIIQPSTTKSHLESLSQVGLCLTSAWSTYLYEPRMKLCVGHNLPDQSLVDEYITNQEGLGNLTSNLVAVLLALPYKPTLITISRSTRDGYTPRWQQQTIEGLILSALKIIFGLTSDDIHYSPALAGGRQGWHFRYKI